jgi:hypothetical protein
MTLYADNTQSEGESSSSVLLEMMYGFKISLALFVAPKLGIAEIGMILMLLKLLLTVTKL